MAKNNEMPQNNSKVCTAAETKTSGISTELKTNDLSDQDFWMQVARLDDL